jgi:hypothetical protein
VTITSMAEARNRLRYNCSVCGTMCEHIGAAVSLVLEEKTALGLAAQPEERRPLEMLSDEELEQQALADRMERGVYTTGNIRLTHRCVAIPEAV